MGQARLSAMQSASIEQLDAERQTVTLVRVLLPIRAARHRALRSVAWARLELPCMNKNLRRRLSEKTLVWAKGVFNRRWTLTSERAQPSLDATDVYGTLSTESATAFFNWAESGGSMDSVVTTLDFLIGWPLGITLLVILAMFSVHTFTRGGDGPEVFPWMNTANIWSVVFILIRALRDLAVLTLLVLIFFIVLGRLT